MRCCGRGRAAFAFLLSLAFPAASHAARGGPDAGGWSWADSNEASVDIFVEPPSAWMSIALPIPGDAVFPVDLGFPFTLYDVTSTTVYVSTNGWISLVNPGTASVPINSGLPDPATPDATIAYLWDQFGTAAGTWLRHGTTANGHLIGIHAWHPSGVFVDVFVQFYRNGAVKIYYGSDLPVAGATVGIEDGNGMAGTELCRDGATAPGVLFARDYALVFYPPSAGSPCATLSPLTCAGGAAGTTAGGTSATALYGCSGRDYNGSEAAFTFTLPTAARFDATLAGLGTRDQDLFLFGPGCHPVWDCIAGGGDAISVPRLEPGSYRLVVDGRTPADDGPFTLSTSLAGRDCNNNGIADACDLASGTSQDCDQDGRPDECGTCPVDIVFIMDTSGSMSGDATELCTVIDDTITGLADAGIELGVNIWGLTGVGFACLDDSVLARLGGTVPGPPLPVPPAISQLDHQESWAPGTAIVAGLYPWTPGAVRVVVPMGDEGPFRGNPTLDPGDDRDSIEHAISVARANDVLVSPISPRASGPAVEVLARDLAVGTGGTWWSLDAAGGGIAEAIEDIARSACLVALPAAEAGPDRRICFGETVLLDGSASSMVCAGAREYRWLEEGVEVCGWSGEPTCPVVPVATTVYTLEVRCEGQSGCGTSDFLRVELEGGGAPASLANTLRGVRLGIIAAFSTVWVPDAISFNLYRGTAKGIWPASPHRTGLPGPTLYLPDVLPPASLYFYRMTGTSCAGLEGE